MPPQITEETTLGSLAKRYLYDYRRFFVEHPRVRLDGVYIAVCHYVLVVGSQRVAMLLTDVKSAGTE